MIYYNENNREAAQWLYMLMFAGEIPYGHIDERSIVDVKPSDVQGYAQCHFFAGIGGWLEALRHVGWPIDRAIWTGSCPCQPFSQAGKQKGSSDDRHLWPYFQRLIAECRPSIVVGEQVASKLGRGWLAGVQADLEVLDYAVGAADLCAASVGAPHIRQRLYWLGKSDSSRWPGRDTATATLGSRRPPVTTGRCDIVRLADANDGHEHWWSGPVQVGRNGIAATIERSGRKHHAQWRLKPGLSLLADGVPGRVDLLRGYGNAIVPQVAAAFLKAALDI